MKILIVSLLAAGLPLAASAQMVELPPDMKSSEMHHKNAPAKPSTALTVTGLDGKTTTYSADDIKNMTHMTVTVHNIHSNADETYSGVAVSELVKRVEPKLATGERPRVKPLMTVIVFGGTDNYHVVLTECDIDSSCHNGTVIVADQKDGKPLTVDGEFKLISTEDKKPQRWVRNLTSIEVKSVQ